MSLIGAPQFVLMDEATSGMDPGSRQLVREVIREAVSQGQAVMMTSHSMMECDLLCDRLAIMVSGRIVLEGDPIQLKEREGGGYKINVKLSDPARRRELDTFLQENFKNIKFLNIKDKWVSYNLSGNISEMLGVLASAKGEFQLEGFTINMTSLDDIFIQATRSDLNNSYKREDHSEEQKSEE